MLQVYCCMKRAIRKFTYYLHYDVALNIFKELIIFVGTIIAREHQTHITKGKYHGPKNCFGINNSYNLKYASLCMQLSRRH